MDYKKSITNNILFNRYRLATLIGAITITVFLLVYHAIMGTVCLRLSQELYETIDKCAVIVAGGIVFLKQLLFFIWAYKQHKNRNRIKKPDYSQLLNQIACEMANSNIVKQGSGG